MKYPVLPALLLFCCALASGAEEARLGGGDFAPTALHPVGWRGDGSGDFPDARPVTRWDEKTGANVRWKLDLPFGFGAPIVVGGRVFTQADPDVLYAVDADTGKIAWQSSDKPLAREDEAATRGGWFAWYGTSYPTPLSDGRVVYTKSADALASYDLDGKVLWKTALAPGGQRPIITQSPLLAGGRIVFVAAMPGKRGQAMLGFDTQTGKEVWRTLLGPDVGSEINGAVMPTLVRLGDVDVVVAGSGDAVRASDGKLLAANLFAAAGYGIDGWELTRAVSPTGEVLVCLRQRGDVALHAMALRLTLDGDTLAATRAWGPKPVEACNGNGPKYDTQIHNTLYLDGHWYVQGWPDLLTLDARDGHTVAWAKAPREMRGHTVWHEYPTPQRAGDCLFTGDRNGTVAVYEAGPRWKLIALNRVDGPWHSSPFFSGDRIYIRTQHALYCLGPKDPAP